MRQSATRFSDIFCFVLVLAIWTIKPVPCLAKDAVVTRCGWIHNPTPANWWLIDKQATWKISEQGESQPHGFDLIPDLSSDFVATNRGYGYACACLSGEFSKPENRVIKITHFVQRRISDCQGDRALPPP
ncbi:DUF4087 domain-containing protein [Methylobacterium sp. NPDC097178]|uniref:DUF4087 domain-containing protein n=1 Tax=Methylobacterium TaxID=407 RepID=UPI0036FEEC1E